MAKISVITPVYNSEKYIEETIQSIIYQKGDFELEYIIVDGLSFDNTNIIINKYLQLLKNKLLHINCKSVNIVHIIEKDNGMYDAVNKGLSISTGSIQCYLNASDLFLPGTLQAINTIFTETNYSWVRGNVCYIDDFSTVQKFEKKLIYLNRYILNGYHGFFNSFASQETMFWRSELMEKVKKIDAKYKYAGDFYLWHCFAKYKPLIQLSIYTSCFRIHSNQKSEAIKKYMDECGTIIKRNKSTLWKINGLIYKYFLRHVFKHKVFYFPFNFLFFKPIIYINIVDNKIELKKSYATIIP